MDNFIYIALGFALLSVLGVMVIGIISMIKGGEFNKKYGNKLMTARVVLQGAAIVLLVLAFASS